MSETKTSIIFVAGAWHTEFHLQPITPYLEAYGYRVVPVKLYTSSHHSPPPTIQDNIAQIHTLVKTEIASGHDVVLIGHSVSGQSVAAAANAFLSSATPSEASKLVHVVFIACFLNAVRATEGATWYDIDWSTMWTTLNTPYESFYNTMSREAAKPFVENLDSNRAQYPPEGVLEDLLKTKLNGTYFLCKLDQAILPERQREEAVDAGMRIVEIEADHCPFVSHPKEFAGQLHEVL